MSVACREERWRGEKRTAIIAELKPALYLLLFMGAVVLRYTLEDILGLFLGLLHLGLLPSPLPLLVWPPPLSGPDVAPVAVGIGG